MAHPLSPCHPSLMPGSGFSRTSAPEKAASDASSSYTFDLGDFSIDEYDPVKVIVIGAGFSGIIAGIRCALPSPMRVAVFMRRPGFHRRYRMSS